MIKSVKVVNNAGMPVENLYIEVEGNSFVSSRNGDLELKAQNPDSVVRINYVGSPEVRTTFGKIGSEIILDNGFEKQTCKSSEVSMDYLTKEIQLLNEEGNPLAGVEVFSETGLTNTTTDANGVAIVKVSNPEEYLSFDGDTIEGQAIAFKSLPSQQKLKEYATAKIDTKKTSNAGAKWLGLLALGGLIWKHAQNNASSNQGLSCPVKITL